MPFQGFHYAYHAAVCLLVPKHMFNMRRRAPLECLFESRAYMDQSCINRGVLFPQPHFMKRWVFTMLSRFGFMQPHIQQIIKDFIESKWDEGAFRCFYAYFYGNNTVAEEVLFQYYLHFYDERRQCWTLWNPSAGAVWWCRVVYRSLSAAELARYV